MSVLAQLDLDRGELEHIADRMQDRAPAAAQLIHSLAELATADPSQLDGLADQAQWLDRADATALTALVEDTRQVLDRVLWQIPMDDWLEWVPDADLVAIARDKLGEAGEALCAVLQAITHYTD